jgi:ATP-dependent RNA helicase RhlB
MHAVYDLGFKYCTPIQGEIFPESFAGKDVTGKAQTGTGKSAAFIISILKHLQTNPPKEGRKLSSPRALILAPTRELVIQLEKDALALSKYMNCHIVPVFGGMDYEKQKQKLTDNVIDIIVATPGRLLDFKKRKNVNLGDIELLVFDEADRMLDMGFLPDISEIMSGVSSKDNRQTMLFSATLSEQILSLASRWTKNQFQVEIEPEQITAETISQQAYLISGDEKYSLIYNLLVKNKVDRTIIFCNRRDNARMLTEKLNANEVNALLLSGEISQKKRIKTLDEFKSGQANVMICTDVAARGIHIEGVTHVINYNLPEDPEVYVHRIGRTGRAGAKGVSIICGCEENTYLLPTVEEFIGIKLEYIQPDEDLLEEPPPAKIRKKPQRPQQKRNNQRKKPTHS